MAPHDLSPVVPVSSHPCDVTIEGQEYQIPAIVVTYANRRPRVWVLIDGRFTDEAKVTRLWWRGRP